MNPQTHQINATHLLQSPAWGQLKRNFGWTPVSIGQGNTVTQVLFRRLPLGFSIAYVPKGPVLPWSDADQCCALFAKIHAEAKRRRAIFLKIEPDVLATDTQAGALTSFLSAANFSPADAIQPQTTIVVDISSAEDDILAGMKQKTRYNIRLAAKKGVAIRQGNGHDVAAFYQLSQLTAHRDGFGIHSQRYYQAAYRLFAPDNCALLFAEYQGKPLAALMVFKHNRDAYYFFGASSNEHRNLMPTYLLQWQAICWAKHQGCTRYDLWGIPDKTEQTLEAEFAERRDGLWGVYRFKRGFGGDIVRSVGAFDYVYNPLLYRLYRWRRGEHR